MISPHLRRAWLRLVPLILLWGSVPRLLPADDAAEFFETRIRPLLANHCYACHTDSKLGNLQLDSREGMLKGGNTGPAIVPGDPENSLLVQAVRHTHERLKMPFNGKLAEEEIGDLVSWVEAGAFWPESPPQPASVKQGESIITPERRSFWSFQPIRKPEPPSVRQPRRVKGEIDRFILAKLEERGLEPVGPADKRTLIRRASFDLIGLPPSPEEVEAFLADLSADAYARVVDRLLASPRYGERWGRYWLDIARYSDDVLHGDAPNFYPYRDWVIQAFNDDMPYDLFVKAQIAGDLLPGEDRKKLLPALTLFVDAPSEFTDDDRVDVTTRGFLGLTVACAKCHDHKYDPIPTQDYYSLLGVFRNTQYREVALAPKGVVEAFQQHKKAVDEQRAELRNFLRMSSSQLGDVLASRTARYLMAAWKVLGPRRAASSEVADQDELDLETLERWIGYLKTPGKQHPYLKKWEQLLAEGAAEEQIREESEVFERFVIDLIRAKKAVDEYNKAVSYGATSGRMLGEVEGRTMVRAKYMLWQDLLAEGKPNASDAVPDARVDGVLYYKEEKAERFLPLLWKEYLGGMRAKLQKLEDSLPPQYPYLSIIEDIPEPKDLHVHVRGNSQNLGEKAPRRFLQVLCQGEPQPFTKGSGRLELAEAIASPQNPLTARVIANRVWQFHFGEGIVRTPSNFGQTGDRPYHPELLDYLASLLIENSWSLKSLHREIMLSGTYQLSANYLEQSFAADPDNRLHWRFNRRRLDVEALRDSLLFVSGALDISAGGPPQPLDDNTNQRRTVYGFVSRQDLDVMLTTFDFPNPNITSEQRVSTNVPLQRLFLLNSDFMMQRAAALAARLGVDPESSLEQRIRRVYQIVFQRQPNRREVKAGEQFLNTNGEAWTEYAQVLLGSNEFLYLE